MRFFDDLWKAELAAVRDGLASTLEEPLEGDDAPFELEKNLFVSASIVRKLIEDNAVTNKLKSKNIDLMQSRSTRGGAEITWEVLIGDLDVRDHFDMENPEEIRMSFHDICSEIIHSNGLIWDVDKNNRVIILILFSYRDTLRRLIWLGMECYLSIVMQCWRTSQNVGLFARTC